MTFVLSTDKQYKAALSLHETYKQMRVQAKEHMKDLDDMIKKSSNRTNQYEKDHQSSEEMNG